MNRTVTDNRFALSALKRAARTLTLATTLALFGLLSACAGGGASTSVNQVSTAPTDSAANYTGPPPANADVQAFKLSFWQNVIPANRCGGCHHAGGQSPQFARSDDVNLAYQAALPLVNLTNPSQSTFVLKVGGGHNCWVADPSACAATMLVWIQGWIGAGSSSTTSVTLVAPPVQAAGGGKQFPVSASAPSPSFATTIYPLLTQFCSGCHTPSSATAQQPYFADSDVNAAYLAAQPKINLSTPTQSRFYERLATEFHHCWPTSTSGGAPDCAGSAAQMLAAIQAFADGIAVTPIDPTLVVSNAADPLPGHDRRGRQPLRGQPGRQVHVRDRPGQHRLRHQRRDAGCGPDAVGQRQLGGRLGHHARLGRQGPGLHQRQPEARQHDPGLG